MVTNVRKEAFLATLDFVLDSEGRKKYIHPMKLRDLEKVQQLFSCFNDDLIILNFPSVITDDQGVPILSEKGEEIIDDSAYCAMLEVLELALDEHRESIESWVDIGHIENILAKYRKVSGLLERKKQMEAQIIQTGM